MLDVNDLPYERLEIVLQEFLHQGTDVTEMDSHGCFVIQMAEKNWPQAADLFVSHIPSGDEMGETTDQRLRSRPESPNKVPSVEHIKDREGMGLPTMKGDTRQEV